MIRTLAIFVVAIISLIAVLAFSSGPRPDHSVTIPMTSPATDVVIDVPAAGGPVSAVEIRVTLTGEASVTHTRSDADVGLQTSPYWFADARWGFVVPVSGTALQIRTSEAYISYGVDPSDPQTHDVTLLREESGWIRGDLSRFTADDWKIRVTGESGVTWTGQGAFSSDGSGVLRVDVIYHSAIGSFAPRLRSRPAVYGDFLLDEYVR